MFSQILSHLRIAIPTWNFFETPGYNPELRVRVRQVSGEWSSWQKTLGRSSKRSWLRLFANGDENLRMYQKNQLERALQEIADDTYADFSSSQTFRILCRLASEGLPADSIYQFKIGERNFSTEGMPPTSGDVDDLSGGDVLISGELKSL